MVKGSQLYLSVTVSLLLTNYITLSVFCQEAVFWLRLSGYFSLLGKVASGCSQVMIRIVAWPWRRYSPLLAGRKAVVPRLS